MADLQDFNCSLSKVDMYGVKANFSSSANRVCSLISNIWSPLSSDNFKRQYFKRQQFPFQEGDLQELSNCFLSETSWWNNLALPGGKHSSQGFELLKSLEFARDQYSLLSHIVDKFQSVKIAPLTVHIKDSFLMKHQFDCLQANLGFTKDCAINPRMTTLSSAAEFAEPLSKPTSMTQVVVKNQEPTKVEINSQTHLVKEHNPIMSVYVEVTKSPKSTIEPMRKDCVDIMNKELVDRKCKKMSKLSKRRRRRNKKCSPTVRNADVINSEMAFSSPISSRTLKKEQSADVNNNCKTSSIQKVRCDFPISIILESTPSESDDDWDCVDDISISMGDINLHFPSCLMTGLTTVHINSTSPIVNASYEVSVFEVNTMSPELLAVNETWQKTMSDVDVTKKQSSKVQFDEDHLVTTFLVERYDRKGEWEVFARERSHFKRRIQRAEELLSPFLAPSYRQKVYQKLHDDTVSQTVA